MIFSTKVLNAFFRCVNECEKLFNNVCIWLRIKRNRTSSTNTVHPNDPLGWERVYLSKVRPVTNVKSEIVKVILDLTTKGESLLETGCGSGTLSAELSIAGRNVSFCDFSQQILDRVKLLFHISGLSYTGAYLVDITKQMPFEDEQFDVIWNSGVLEHWTDDELKPIVNELARCAKRCVISLVPNEKSVLYRYGRESAEKCGIAPWGREIPRNSLKDIFENVGLVNIKECTVCASDAPNLIGIIDPIFARKIKQWWNAIPETDPVKINQGYLLLTVGYKKIT